MAVDDLTLSLNPQSGTLRLQMPGILADLLLAVASDDDGAHPVTAPGPLAAASTAALERDPLADLEAQFVADELAAAQKAARAASAEAATRMLATRNHDADVDFDLSLDAGRELVSWLNHHYVRLRVAEITAINTGEGQSALGLMGFGDDDSGDPSDPMSVPTFVFAALVSALTVQLDTLAGLTI